MRALELTKGVYWVGAIDWNLREFHGYATSKGSTYNAYLVVDDKVALIDNVKQGFTTEMLLRISSVVDPANIDYLISNHTELDHCGSAPEVMSIAKKATLVTSKRAGEQAIARHFHANWPTLPVAEGSQISLGKRTLQFIPIPMLHWPDSMATYLVEDQILFPNDAFGQHYTSAEMFDDAVDLEEVMAEAKKYYATILMPFGQLVLRAIDKLKGVPIKMIAPSHGIIWRSDPSRIVQAYASWASGEARRKAVIVYDTMWLSTEKMAIALGDGLASKGVEVKTYDLKATHVSQVVTDLLDARALLVGSPTLNNGMLPTVAGLLYLLKGLKPKGKVGLAFGSYGWGGGAIKAIESELQAAGIELLEPGISYTFVPDGKELTDCFDLGQRLAARIE